MNDKNNVKQEKLNNILQEKKDNYLKNQLKDKSNYEAFKRLTEK